MGASGITTIPRRTAKIFAGNYGLPSAGSPTGVLAEYGQKALTGTATYSNDPANIQTAQWLAGQAAAIISGQGPFLTDHNAIYYVLSFMNAYLYQQGVAEYDTGTNYRLYGLCQSGGVIYVSQLDQNLNNSLADTNSWLRLGDTQKGAGIAKAWGSFTDNGSGTVTMVQGFNITSIALSGTGNYIITIPGGVLSDANYMVQASQAQVDAVGALDSITQLPGDTKTTTSLQVRCLGGVNSAPSYAPKFYVALFSNP